MTKRRKRIDTFLFPLGRGHRGDSASTGSRYLRRGEAFRQRRSGLPPHVRKAERSGLVRRRWRGAGLLGNTQPIRRIFREAFACARLPYFNRTPSATLWSTAEHDAHDRALQGVEPEPRSRAPGHDGIGLRQHGCPSAGRACEVGYEAHRFGGRNSETNRQLFDQVMQMVNRTVPDPGGRSETNAT